MVTLCTQQGDLSFLMPAAPVLRQWFASQLNLEIQGEYDKRQLAVWQEVLRDGEQFQVAPNWKRLSFPSLLKRRSLLLQSSFRAPPPRVYRAHFARNSRLRPRFYLPRSVGITTDSPPSPTFFLSSIREILVHFSPVVPLSPRPLSGNAVLHYNQV